METVLGLLQHLPKEMVLSLALHSPIGSELVWRSQMVPHSSRLLLMDLLVWMVEQAMWVAAA
jgi:hypothetical protein